MEVEDEERGYHTNYSPSPPRQEHYQPQQHQNYRSDEYESPEPEPSPPRPSPPPRKEIRHSKPNKEGYNHRVEKKRDRDEERQRRTQQQTPSSDPVGGKIEGCEGKKHSSDREQQSVTHKSSKRSKKSGANDGKREEKKRGGDDGQCWFGVL